MTLNQCLESSHHDVEHCYKLLIEVRDNLNEHHYPCVAYDRIINAINDLYHALDSLEYHMKMSEGEGE